MWRLGVHWHAHRSSVRHGQAHPKGLNSSRSTADQRTWRWRGLLPTCAVWPSVGVQAGTAVRLMCPGEYTTCVMRTPVKERWTARAKAQPQAQYSQDLQHANHPPQTSGAWCRPWMEWPSQLVLAGQPSRVRVSCARCVCMYVVRLSQGIVMHGLAHQVWPNSGLQQAHA
jgi:hypothetical protein